MATVDERKKAYYTCDIWVPTGKLVRCYLQGSVKLTNNFCVYEYANSLAKETVKLVIYKDSWTFMNRVQKLRDRYFKQFGVGLNISSGYRTETFNKSCGGSLNSAHLDMRAADFINIPKIRYTTIEKWWKEICEADLQVGGINFYNDNRIHITDYENKFGNKSFVRRDYR